MKKTKAFEVNFDGLVGPTHNYGGLPQGNVASSKNKLLKSYPKEAALQGLAKMKFVMDLGLKQAVLPPQERPDLHVLRRLGFEGSDEKILQKVNASDPRLLLACSSASNMWAANAATVSPSADTQDSKVHFTPANLIYNFHRSLEAHTTGLALKAIFTNPDFFTHHDPLPASQHFGDEGAANHTRFCSSYESPGLEFFVYGKSAFGDGKNQPKNFPARQTLEASQALARLHKLNPEHVVFAQQAPTAIDAGAFHNDVVAVGNGNVLFYHENAFLAAKETITALKTKFQRLSKQELIAISVSDKDVSLSEAVSTYLFNTQLLSLPNGKMALIAPTECQENVRVKTYLENLLQDKSQPIAHAHFVDVRQSMRNGGGPACLRLRVSLNEDEILNANPNVFLDEILYKKLCDWVNKNYRDELTSADLADPHLLKESRAALDELTQILKLGSIYPFQQV